ncbi:MAG: hypothetical protein ACRYG7_46580 [Janthinobacterium lividum]
MDEPSLLSVAEQVVAAELAYYHQEARCQLTLADQTTWQSQQVVSQLLALPEPVTFSRHVLERHGYSLHRFMATHLCAAAWHYWFTQGGLLIPFRKQNPAGLS